jgi:hypothetical protein
VPKLSQKDERQFAVARRLMDRHEVALSVPAQGENSPHMTEEFKQRIAEAEERLAPYTVAARAKVCR